MARPIELTVEIAAEQHRVWSEVADLASHPEWMGDATMVEFLSDGTRGVGTRIAVPTRVGPFGVTDVMEVVAWDEGREIRVEHQGAVTGWGRFEIQPAGRNGTLLRWQEALRFPWWLGGRLGDILARPFLIRVWQKSLDRLRERVEVSGP